MVVAGASGCSTTAPPTPRVTPDDGRTAASSGWNLPAGPRIVFRNTQAGDSYGRVASVPLKPGAREADPERTVSGLTCERVDATRQALSCLSRIETNPVGYRATLF